MKNKHKFKKGDKVVIVGDFDFYTQYNITKDEVYEVGNTYNDKNEKFFYFKNNDFIHINERNSNNFILLTEYRKLKLKKLCSNYI